MKTSFRLRRADGEYRWHQGRGVPLKDDAGKVVKWVGTFTDITSHKKAEQMHAALFERERNIAGQLQAALQPELPGAVNGLAVTKYYAPALVEEAGVGGDFYDCYFLDHEKRRSALIVGDVSGKGLAAAAQVATVRHGLRTALFMSESVSGAVGSLNNLLVEQEALTSFATLFVGAYDSVTRRLCYVNCGQEPALIRRAFTGVIDELGATGSVLGCFSGLKFPEKTIILGPGDALAIYSDGLTDVGSSPAAMLGVGGVMSLFGQSVPDEKALTAGELAERLISHVIAGVNEAAASGGDAR